MHTPKQSWNFGTQEYKQRLSYAKHTKNIVETNSHYLIERLSGTVGGKAYTNLTLPARTVALLVTKMTTWENSPPPCALPSNTCDEG